MQDLSYKEPWLILTDLEPEEGNTKWYSLRAWIESSYRDLKSDGWQWQKTRLREPARAERIWLAMAVATLWTVTMGNDEQSHLQETLKAQAIPIDEIQPKSALKKTIRNVSCFLQGLINIIADLLCGKAISFHGLFPDSSFALNTS